MSYRKRKQFDADYWRKNFDLLVSTVEKLQPSLSVTLDQFLELANKKKLLKTDKTMLEDSLNKQIGKIKQACWERFLKRVRDRNYETGRCRITISSELNSKLGECIDKYNFDNTNEFIDFAIDTIPKKQLRQFKNKKS